MKPFELRLAQEHLKVRNHLKNLENFICDPTRFLRLQEDQRALMELQTEYLAKYLSVLEARMNLLNIPV